MTTEQKAVDLINEMAAEWGLSPWRTNDICRSSSINDEALCRAIERHEAFRREVSEKVKALIETGKVYEKTRPKPCQGPEFYAHAEAIDALSDLILPDPDPLAEALKDAGIDPDAVFKVLAAQGLRVTEAGHD